MIISNLKLGNIERFVEMLSLPDNSHQTLDNDDLMNNVMLVPREVTQHSGHMTTEEARYSYRVSEVLVCGLPLNRKLLDEAKPRVIQSLMRIVEPNSRGNFKHFSKVFLSFGRQQKDVLEFVTLESLSVPLLLQLLRCVIQPEIADCLMLLIRWGPADMAQKRKKLYEYLLSIQFIDTLLDLCTMHHHENLAIAASELFVRLYKQSTLVKESFIMYLGITGEHERLSRFIPLLTDVVVLSPAVRNAYIDLIQCVVVPHPVTVIQTIMPALTIESIKIHAEPQKCAIEILFTLIHEWCSEKLLLNDKLPVSVLLLVLNVIQVIVSAQKDDEKRLDYVSTCIPWTQLVDWFFSRFKNNNLYHVVFFKLVSFFIHQHHEQTLRLLFLPSETDGEPGEDLAVRLLESFDAETANRGIVRLLLNVLRLYQQAYPTHFLTTQVLEANTTWQDIQQPLIEETLRTVKRTSKFDLGFYTQAQRQYKWSGHEEMQEEVMDLPEPYMSPCHEPAYASKSIGMSPRPVFTSQLSNSHLVDEVDVTPLELPEATEPALESNEMEVEQQNDMQEEIEDFRGGIGLGSPYAVALGFQPQLSDSNPEMIIHERQDRRPHSAS